MAFTSGKPLRPLPATVSGSLRVLLINSCVSRNTKAMVSIVKENRHNLMPKVASSIFEAMDRVAKEAAETIRLVFDIKFYIPKKQTKKVKFKEYQT